MVWPTDVSTLDVDAMVVRETPTVSAAYPFTGQWSGDVYRSENRLGPDLAGLLPGTRTQGIIEMLATRPGDDYQLAREPLNWKPFWRGRAKRGTDRTTAAGSRRKDRLHCRTAAQ